VTPVISELPDLNELDLEQLKALLLEKHAKILRQNEAIIEQQAALTARNHEIENLKLLILKLKRLKFGRSSEKLDRQIEQLELRLEEMETAEAAASEQQSEASAKARTGSPRRKSPRGSMPSHLEREVQTHAPKHEVCPDCGGSLNRIGEDVSEMLEYVPAHFKVIQIVRPKCCCKNCSKILQEPAPHRPVERGMAGPGLLAHVLVSKYGDHLPLYRQSDIYDREGLDLSRSTLASWVGGAAHTLQPLIDLVRDYVLNASKLHGDDIPVPVLDPGRGKTKTGRLWTYVRDDGPAGSTDPPAVWFAYSPDRKAEHPANHLRDFRGVLQADAYVGFNRLYEQGRIIEAACWAHVRRKFYDAYQAHSSPIAEEALKRIGELYAIEEQIRGRSPEQRQRIRSERTQPLLHSLEGWLKQCLEKLFQKSDVARAIHYALERWTSLLRYVHDGRLEIDNNAAERSLRAIALGRKNYLFQGSDAGGEYAAAMYTLIGTAKLNDLDPEAYLSYVLSHIADHPMHRLQELLPWNTPVRKISRSSESEQTD
jgi:transposase